MTEAIITRQTNWASTANKALKLSTSFWLIIALIGQLAFVYYIAVHYGGAAITGDKETVAATTLKGHVSGDVAGNFFFISHILMAATITLGGTLQLIPQIRKRAMGLHRWNGRVFLVTALAISLGGFYLVWVRGATTSFLGSISVSLNGVLLMLCAVLTWHYVRKRDIARHRRWAMRTFLLVNGVWFFRIGLFAWIILNQGPVGVGENFDGPFVITLGFAQFVIPLAVLELYLRVQDHCGAGAKLTMAAGLFALTALMALGIFGAFMFMWLPFL